MPHYAGIAQSRAKMDPDLLHKHVVPGATLAFVLGNLSFGVLGYESKTVE